MLEKILLFSIRQRWLMLLFTAAAAGLGLWMMQHLLIDAVPDITPNQVQINSEATELSPEEMEQQVTFPIETAMAGIPGLQNTRSLTRSGFSQVTVIFADSVDIYFARQQILERLGEVREKLPPGVDPRMGAITTGLGEIYMWTVEYEHPDGRNAPPLPPGQPGWQADGSFLTPENKRLATAAEQIAYLRTVQDWIISPQLKTVPGVAGVDAIGGHVAQYQVEPDPKKLIEYRLTFHEVIEALERNNSSVGAGYIEHQGEAWLVRSAGRIRTAEEIGNIVVAEFHGTPIRLSDIARVGAGQEPRTGSASENGHEIVVGTAMMLIGANSRIVSAAVNKKMSDIQASLPPGIRAKTVLNRTKLVDATIETVSHSLVLGAILVVVVLLLLLGNIRAALITALAIPLSMLLAATGMVQAGISGNLMSLGAIDFGLIVDGAVIIVENCIRCLAEKQHELGRALTREERLAVVYNGSRQVRTATAFGEAIIIIVYLPLLFLTGIEGKLFFPMAMTVIFALVAAFVLSLTFIPALVATAMTGKVREQENILLFGAKRGYRPPLEWAIRRHWWVLGGALALFVGALGLFFHLGQEFVPVLDEKDLAMHAMRIPSTGLDQSTAMQLKVEQALVSIPEIAFVFSKTGTAEMAADPMPPSVSDTFIIFKPEDQWRSAAELDQALAAFPPLEEPADAHGDEHAGHGDEHEAAGDHAGHEDHHGPAADLTTRKGRLIALIQRTVADLPGNNYEMSQPIQMRFNELIAGIRSDVAVKIYGDDFDVIRPTAEAIARTLQNIPGAADIKVEQTEGFPVMNLRIDRAALARYGLSVADVQEVLSIAVGGRVSGQVLEGDRRFDLVVRLADDIRRDRRALEQLPIPLPDHDEPAAGRHGAEIGNPAAATPLGFIPLSAVATFELTEGLNQISRENGKRRIVVQVNVRGRDLGSFVAAAQAAIAREIPLPAGSWLDWGGQFENLIAARERLMVVVPICFLLIFLLLFSSFGSVRDALMVFTAVPLALTGGILALWLRGLPFSISAAVGFIALSGVAVLNGLVLLTFINELRRSGLELAEAVRRGAMTRLRPVLMTALVASLGFVPMALATGTGAEVQRPLATVVIGGLVSATLLTLLVLPALYVIVHRKNPRASAAAPAVEPAATPANGSAALPPVVETGGDNPSAAGSNAKHAGDQA